MEKMINSKIIEQSILASIIQNPSLIYETGLTAEDFDKYTGVEYNRSLFEILDYISRKKDMENSKFDEVTIINYIDKFHNVREVFAKELGSAKDNAEQSVSKYVRALHKFDVDSKSIDMYITELKKISAVNEIVLRNEKINIDLENNYKTLELEDVLQKVEEEVLEITDTFTDTTDKAEHIAEGMMEEFMNREVVEKSFKGFESPFPSIDKYTRGILRKGAVTVINAQTNVGKSLILKSIVKKIGVDLKQPIYWGANEMTLKEQRERLLSEMTGIPMIYIENGLYNKPGNEKLKQKISRAIAELQKSPIYLDQMDDYTPEKLLRRARYFKKKYGIVGFVWDYVKVSSAYRGKDEMVTRHWLGNVVNVMKEKIAIPLDIFVITASQAKTYDSMLAAESQDIERYASNFLILKTITKEEREKFLFSGDFALIAKKTRSGKKHNFEANGECVELRLDENRLLFQEVNK
jgi:replicative DNA helicase